MNCTSSTSLASQPCARRVVEREDALEDSGHLDLILHQADRVLYIQSDLLSTTRQEDL